MVICALPLSAQVEGADNERVSHAEIGTLQAVETDGTILTSLPTGDGDYAHRTYRTGPMTAVRGLGGIMDVAEIPADVHGRVVMVEFVQDSGAQSPMALKLQFPTAREIQVTHGSVAGIDIEGRRLTVANVDGATEMDLGVGYGAMIDDAAEGIVSLRDLKLGQGVTVYYADAQALSTSESLARTAYLIVRTD